jgi:hypothetical protein
MPSGTRSKAAQASKCRPWKCGNREHVRFAPQNLRGWHWREGHRLDLEVEARLIGVHLQKHIADAQGRALGMGDDDSDLIHGRPASRK